MDGKKVWIHTDYCCGALCAYVFRGDGERWADEELASKHDAGDLYTAWRAAEPDSLEERIAEFDSWWVSIQKMLSRLLEAGVITHEQEDAAVAEWQLKYPNPHLENAG